MSGVVRSITEFMPAQRQKTGLPENKGLKPNRTLQTRANTSVYVRRLDTGSVAGCFYSGDSIPVNGKRGNWYTFNYNGIAYKVYAKYVTKSYDRNENDVDAKIHKSRSMGEILDGGVYSNTIKKHKISKDSNDWSWVEVFF